MERLLTKRKRFLAVLAAVIAVSGLPINLVPAYAAAGDGTGTMSVTPQTANAGSSGNNFSFVFTAGAVNGDLGGNGSQARVSIPAGWTAPTTAAGAGNITVAPSGTACNTAAFPATPVSGSGPWTITINIRCNAARQFTLTYNSVTASGTAGPHTFTTETKGTAAGAAFASVAASPIVTVAPGAASKLVFTTSPHTTTEGTSTGTITVQQQDAANNPVNAGAGGVTVTLSSDSGSGVFRNQADTAALAGSQVTIASGSSSASFRYRDTANGTFTMTAAASGLTSGTQSVTVNNAAPVANDDTLGVTEEIPNSTNVLANDTDPGNDSLTVTSETDGAKGTASCTGAGVCTYTPNSNATGADSFDYVVTDGSLTDTGTVNVTITNVNDAPVASSQPVSTPEDFAVIITLSATDVDGQALTFSPGSPTNGSLVAAGPINCSGSPTSTCTKEYGYTPAANYNGPDSFTFTAGDGTATSNTATVTITIGPDNDNPDLSGIPDVSFPEDGSDNSIDLDAYFTDVETTDANATFTDQGGHAGLDVAIDGVTHVLTVTGDPDFNGVVNVTVRGTDTGDPAGCTPVSASCAATEFDDDTFQVTVTAVDDAPVAVDDSDTVTEDSGANTIDVLANDTDIDAGPKFVSSVSDPANGAAAVTNAGADVSYTPDADTCGSDSFTYTLNGGATATVSVTVDCVDDVPTANDDSAAVSEDSGANTIDVLANDDNDDGGPLTIESKTNGTNGSVAITNGGADLTYTPAADYCNTSLADDTFTYTLNGGDTATVSVTVNCVDDAPTANDDSDTVTEDSGANTIDVLANDTDSDGGPMFVNSKTNGTNGSVAITNGGADLTYTPDADTCGSDTFTYTLNGGDTATVSMTVDCVDDAPTANDDSATVTEDSGANTIDVLANDDNADGGPLSVSSVSDPANGAAAVTNAGADLTYTPDADTCGSDSFTYTLNGGATATVSVTVDCVNDGPDAVNDAATVDEGSADNAVDVLANDSDVDGDTVSVVAGSESDPANGSATCDASECTYTPDAGFSGADSFTYDVSDGNGGSDSATVDVTVDALGGGLPPDTTAPVGTTLAETSQFSPNGDGRFDEANFEAVFNETTEWEFEIVPESAFAAHPAAIVSQTGKGKSFAFTWDGSSGASPAAEGSYVWALAGKDAFGNEMETITGRVLIDRSAPLLTGIGASRERYRPARHGLLDIAFGVNEASTVKMKIVRKGKTYKRFGPSPTSDATDLLFTWNGRSGSGLRAPAGTYRVVIKAVDLVKNKVVNRALTFELVR